MAGYPSSVSGYQVQERKNKDEVVFHPTFDTMEEAQAYIENIITELDKKGIAHNCRDCETTPWTIYSVPAKNIIGQQVMEEKDNKTKREILIDSILEKTNKYSREQLEKLLDEKAGKDVGPVSILTDGWYDG